jgi:RND superfamily putative drug exporter
MSSPAVHRHAPDKGQPSSDPGFSPGPLGRLGVWVTDHAKLVTAV